ncbi:hypothetical protein VYU27_007234 [Nannochloropsis oceanica]
MASPNEGASYPSFPPSPSSPCPPLTSSSPTFKNAKLKVIETTIIMPQKKAVEHENDTPPFSPSTSSSTAPASFPLSSTSTTTSSSSFYPSSSSLSATTSCPFLTRKFKGQKSTITNTKGEEEEKEEEGTVKVGYAFLPKKMSSMAHIVQDPLSHLEEGQPRVVFRAIDMGRDLEGQGPWDAILHKLSEDVALRDICPGEGGREGGGHDREGER